MLSDLLNDSLSFKTRELCLLLDANCIFDRLSSHVFFSYCLFLNEEISDLNFLYATTAFPFTIYSLSRLQGCGYLDDIFDSVFEQ